MKNTLILLLLCCTLTISGATYYVSPGGSDSNPGTIGQPFFTLKKAWTVIQAGDIVYLRGGTYLFPTSQELTGKSGTSANPIKIWAYPGENPVITKSSSFTYFNRSGIYFEGDYFYWKGITVTGFTQIDDNLWNDMVVQNANHNTIEQMTFSYSVIGFDVSHKSNDNLIINCDFHNNYDPLTSSDPYGNADGANAHTDYGTTNTFRNCRFWSNSDDGIDLYNGDGLIYIDGCWSWKNGYRENGTTKGGDGYGFKLGQTSSDYSTTHLRSITNCLSFFNRLGGFAINQGKCIVWLYNNIAYHNNNGTDYSLGFTFDDHNGIAHIFKNNIGYGNQNTDGLEANWTSESIQDHNSWDGGVTVTNADFAGIDSTGVSGARSLSGSLPGLNFLHLVSTSDLLDAGVSVGIPFNGNSPDLGAFEYQSGSIVSVPSFQSSAIENATPANVDMNYDLSLNNSIVPVPSSFSVIVNSAAKTVTSVTVSGTKVQLTLASPIAYGDIVTISYTKPSINPLQTTSGGIALTLSTKPVTNKVSSPVPVYVSSAVANATPSLLELTYNLTLASIVPVNTSFLVLVNSVARTVSSVAITGSKVQLTLTSAVKFGDIVTVSYTKPATNPLQTVTGALASNISVQATINNLINLSKEAPIIITMTISPRHIHNIINLVFTYSVVPTTALSPEIIRISDLSGKLLIEKYLVTGITNIKIPLNLNSGIYSVTLSAAGFNMASQRIVLY